MEWAWSHSLIGYEWYDKLVEDCDNLSDWNSEACVNDTNKIQDDLFNNINIYDLYGTCLHNDSSVSDNQRYLRFLKESNPRLGIVPPCCAWKGAYNYLTNQTVREAFHIPSFVQSWELCVEDLDYHIDFKRGSIYVYPFLIKSGIRIWIYSGDVDGSVPFTGTRKWIQSLGLDVVKEYNSWYVNEQVAGYFEEYKGLTFLTIKGAGHMVPQWKRPQAHYFFNKFIRGESLRA